MFGARSSHVHPTVGLVLPPAGSPGTLGSPYPLPLPTMAATADAVCDLRKLYAGPINNQGQLERCVGEAMREAEDFAIRGKGAAISDLAVWKDALAIEGLRTGGQFVNSGCDTVDAYNAASSRGWRARDARDDDPSLALAPEDVDELVARVRVPVACFAPLADGDVDSLAKWATAGCCATCTLWVGPVFQAANSQNPIWNGEQSTDGGGYHRTLFLGVTMLSVGGVQTPHAIIQNSWGTGSGDGGYIYCPLVTYAKLVTEPVVHRGGVVLQGVT